MIRFVGFYRRSEEDADSAIDDPPVERRPRVNGPATVGGAAGTNQWIPPRLSHTGKVLAVHENPQPPELPLCEQTDDRVRSTQVAERILFEPLDAGVVQLDADAPDILALPHPDQAG